MIGFPVSRRSWLRLKVDIIFAAGGDGRTRGQESD